MESTSTVTNSRISQILFSNGSALEAICTSGIMQSEAQPELRLALWEFLPSARGLKETATRFILETTMLRDLRAALSSGRVIPRTHSCRISGSKGIDLTLRQTQRRRAYKLPRAAAHR